MRFSCGGLRLAAFVLSDLVPMRKGVWPRREARLANRRRVWRQTDDEASLPSAMATYNNLCTLMCAFFL